MPLAILAHRCFAISHQPRLDHTHVLWSKSKKLTQVDAIRVANHLLLQDMVIFLFSENRSANHFALEDRAASHFLLEDKLPAHANGNSKLKP